MVSCREGKGGGGGRGGERERAIVRVSDNCESKYKWKMAIAWSFRRFPYFKSVITIVFFSLFQENFPHYKACCVEGVEMTKARVKQLEDDLKKQMEKERKASITKK